MSTEDNYSVLKYALENYVPEGWAAEFGVYSGTSLTMIAEYMPVIGFDSFEGLPEDWREGFPKGAFGDGTLPMVPAYGHNVMLRKGWFEDTVPGFPFPILSLVHIDCDLYSSTVTALDGVWPYIDNETVFVFDEYRNYPGWEEHEHKAWTEALALHDVTAVEVTPDGYTGEAAAFVLGQVPR